MIDCRGRAVALNAGGRTKAASAYYLPLERVVRALNIVRAHWPEGGALSSDWSASKVPRGDLQATLLFKGFDEVRRLGLRPETEAAVRAAPTYCHGVQGQAWRRRQQQQQQPVKQEQQQQANGGTVAGEAAAAAAAATANGVADAGAGADADEPRNLGMLVVDSVVPGSAADGALEPGDVLVRVNGAVVTHFLPLAEALDAAVGGSVALSIERGGAAREVEVKVTNLHAVTPSRLLEVCGGVVHALSYQQARNNRGATGQVYVAEPGYILNRAGIPKGAIITALDGAPTPDLESFAAALRRLPHGARAPLEFFTFGERHRKRSAILQVDRQWYGPALLWARDDAAGAWHPSEDFPPGAPGPPCNGSEAAAAAGSAAAVMEGEQGSRQEEQQQQQQEGDKGEAATAAGRASAVVAAAAVVKDDAAELPEAGAPPAPAVAPAAANGRPPRGGRAASAAHSRASSAAPTPPLTGSPAAPKRRAGRRGARNLIADAAAAAAAEAAAEAEAADAAAAAAAGPDKAAAPPAPTLPLEDFEAALRACLCLVDVDVPLVALTDGVHSRSFAGNGLVVFHGARTGLVLTDRNTVAVGPCDVNLSFGAHPAEITGRVRFLHPLHNFAIVSYAVADLPPEARAKVRAAPLLPAPPLRRGESVRLVGLTKFLRVMQRASVVTNATAALTLAAAEVPRFRAVHEEVVKLDHDFGSAFSGVITDDAGRVRALWGSYAEQVDKEEREWCAGLPAHVFAPWVGRLAALEASPALPTPPVRCAREGRGARGERVGCFFVLCLCVFFRRLAKQQCTTHRTSTPTTTPLPPLGRSTPSSRPCCCPRRRSSACRPSGSRASTPWTPSAARSCASEAPSRAAPPRRSCRVATWCCRSTGGRSRASATSTTRSRRRARQRRRAARGAAAAVVRRATAMTATATPRTAAAAAAAAARPSRRARRSGGGARSRAPTAWPRRWTSTAEAAPSRRMSSSSRTGTSRMSTSSSRRRRRRRCPR